MARLLYEQVFPDKPKKNKYNAKKTVVDGITFDSLKEANRYKELCQLKKAKEEKERVVNIELQPSFDLIVNKQKIGTYKADFRITYADGRVEVEDVKGYKKGCAYQLFSLKKKIVEAYYSISVIEI